MQLKDMIFWAVAGYLTASMFELLFGPTWGPILFVAAILGFLAGGMGWIIKKGE